MSISFFGAAHDVVMQPDGKIVLAGIGVRGFGLARLTTTGSLDTGFGSGGLVDTSLPAGAPGSAHAVALAPDGRILAGNVVRLTTGAAPDDFAIARYLPDGTLDTTFGNGGVAFAGFGPPYGTVITSIAVLPDGHVLAAGIRGTNGTGDFAVAKFSPNGSLDTTFGAGGRVTVDFYSALDSASGMTVQPDGKILVVGGSARPPSGRVLSAIRLETDGSLDPSFGDGGKLVLANGYAGSVAVDGPGRIVIGGTMGAELAAFRLTSAGALDSTFGAGGVARSGILGDSAMIEGLALQPDGKYLLEHRSS